MDSNAKDFVQKVEFNCLLINSIKPALEALLRINRNRLGSDSKIPPLENEIEGLIAALLLLGA